MQDSTLILRVVAAGGRLKDGTDSEFKIVASLLRTKPNATRKRLVSYQKLRLHNHMSVV